VPDQDHHTTAAEGPAPGAARAAPLSSSSSGPGSPPATRPAPTGLAEGSPTPFRPPPGWYPDPAGGDRQRWWDGRSWCDDTRPAERRPPDEP